ncbi:MAG TPA: DUF4292 domain-containing protein [Bacteroidota bacterium]|nr:DUF4292 domain-containing protein [Bacteroidota bacterium]
MKGVLILSLVLLSSCAPTKELRKPAISRSAREVIDAVNNNRYAVSTFDAKGSISVETPSFMNSGSFELWLKRPDSVRVDVEGPFGIHVASALFAHDRYVFYNSFKNEVMEGKFDVRNMPDFMNIRLDPSDIVDTFCGTRRFLPDESLPDSFSIDRDSYMLLFRHDNGTTRYRVDGENLRITSVEHIDFTGNVWSEEHFEFEKDGNGAVVPESIELNEVSAQSSVSLFYDKVHINKPVSAMVLDVPADAQRITRK